MRITDNMRFNTTLRNLFGTQSQYNYLMEKIASQKKVNRASDDPVAATRIINIRQSKAAIEQYMKNIDSSNTWISATESTLSGVSKLLDSANKIAIGSMGADPPTRVIAAANIQAIIDSMFSLANTKWGDSYLFSGSQTSTQPFSSVENPPIIGDPAAAGDNVYAGGVSSSAAFTGLTDKNYQVMIDDGGNLGAATYQIFDGTSWGAVQDDLDTGTTATADIMAAPAEAVANGMRITFAVAAALIVLALAIAAGACRTLRKRELAP
jgi:flagellar hook-associated protein 3